VCVCVCVYIYIYIYIYIWKHTRFVIHLELELVKCLSEQKFVVSVVV